MKTEFTTLALTDKPCESQNAKERGGDVEPAFPIWKNAPTWLLLPGAIQICSSRNSRANCVRRFSQHSQPLLSYMNYGSFNCRSTADFGGQSAKQERYVGCFKIHFHHIETDVQIFWYLCNTPREPKQYQVQHK